MAKTSLVPILLPADPTAALHAATKQYVDNLAFAAGEIATEPVGTILAWAGSTAPSSQYLICDGSSQLRSVYPELFSVISTTFGPGSDPGNTFSLPNLSGKFALGVSVSHPLSGTGSTGGQESVTLDSVAQMPNHSHGGTSGNDSPDHGHHGDTGTVSADHSHGVSIQTGGRSAAHTHDIYAGSVANRGTGSSGAMIAGQGPSTTSTESADHSHGVNGNTGGISANHTHSFDSWGANARHAHSVTAEGGNGAHENMPPFQTVTYIIKATRATTGDLGPGIEIRDENSLVFAGATKLDFVGGQVSATLNGTKVDITIPGAPSGAPADQIATPSTPPAGKNKLYFKSNGKLYMLDSAGLEQEVGTGAAGGGGGGGSSVGTIDTWAGPISQIPVGYLPCDGSSQIRSAYPELFAAIGNKYGDGANPGVTFALPNYNGRFPVGADGTYPLGATGGAATHSLSIAEMPSHDHTPGTGVDDRDHTHGVMVGHSEQGTPEWTVGGGSNNLGIDRDYTAGSGGRSTGHFHGVTAQGGGGAHNNMPPYLATYYIIKALPVGSGLTSTALHPNPDMEIVAPSTAGTGATGVVASRDVPTTWSGFWGNTTFVPPWRSATDTPTGLGKSLELIMPAGLNSKPQSASFAVIPGSRVRVGAWVKVTATASVTCELHIHSGTNYTPDFFDGASTIQGTLVTSLLKTTWAYVEATFIIPAGHNRARMMLTFVNGGATQISAFVDTTVTSMDPIGVTPAVNGTLPIGAIAPYAGASLPGGWLLCDGTAKKRSEYVELFAAIGTTHGTGDGSTTFNLPDLRGRAAIGVGTGSGLSARALGAKGGEESHILTAAESGLRNHYHDSVGHGYVSYGGGTLTASQSALNWAISQGMVGGGLADANGAAHNVMQPFTALNYIIKANEIYQGIGGDTLEWAGGSPAAGTVFGQTAQLIPIIAGSFRGSGCTLVPSGTLTGTIQINKAGVYRISGNITATAGSAGYLHGQLGVYRGGTGIAFYQAVNNIGGGGYGSVDMDQVVELQVGDSIGLVAAAQINSNIDARSNLAINRLSGPGPKGDPGPAGTGGAAGVSVSLGTPHGSAVPTATQGTAVTLPAGVLRGMAAMGGWKSTGDGIVGNIYLDGVMVGTCIVNQSHITNAHMALTSVSITPTIVTAGTHYIYFRSTTGNFDSDPCSFFGVVSAASGTFDDPVTALNLRLGSDQSVPAGTWTKMSGWTVQNAYPAWAAENAGTFTVPADGYYRIDFFGSHSSATGPRIARIAINGISVSEQNHGPNATYDGVAATWWEGLLVAGNTVDFQVYCTAAGTMQGSASGKVRAVIRKVIAGASTTTGPWTALPFSAYWGNVAGFRTAQYRKVDNMVELRGLCAVQSGGGYTCATLPAGFRPAEKEIFSPINADYVAWRLDVGTDGALVLGSSQGISLNPNDWISLSGIRFEAG